MLRYVVWFMWVMPVSAIGGKVQILSPFVMTMKPGQRSVRSNFTESMQKPVASIWWSRCRAYGCLIQESIAWGSLQ
jgi:hypothetical protein